MNYYAEVRTSKAILSDHLTHAKSCTTKVFRACTGSYKSVDLKSKVKRESRLGKVRHVRPMEEKN